MLSLGILFLYYKDKKGNYIENIKTFIGVFLLTFFYDFSWLMTVGDVLNHLPRVITMGSIQLILKMRSS
jgi:hypothetical protein